MSGKVVTLRPHHGMCLAYFVGGGYSEGFSAHMGRVLASLTPETPIALRSGADVICTRCPNDRDGLCETQEKVSRYDGGVLDRCGLEEGAELPFGAFTALIQARILEPGLRSGICGDCQWNDLCSGQPSRWNAK